MNRLIGLILVLLVQPVYADTLTVSWVAPTQREDGTALPASEIAGYRLTWTVKDVEQPAITVPPGTSYTLDTGTLVGKTCVTLATVDTDGLMSAPTDPACRKAKPGKPGSLKVK